VPDIWQLHAALNNDKAHNAPAEFIANPAEKCEGLWIQLTANADGSFIIRNSRTQFEKAYR
jgi:hypothetical protein